MSYGLSFDEQIRLKLVEIAKKADGFPFDYVELNKIIMEIQQPLIDRLDRIKEALK